MTRPGRSHPLGLGAAALLVSVVISLTAPATGPDVPPAGAVAPAQVFGGGIRMTADPSGGYWTTSTGGTVRGHDGAPTHGSLTPGTSPGPIVAMAATSDGAGYWLVDSDGDIFAFGDAQPYGSTGQMRLNQPVVGMAPTADGGGYWLVASDGGVFAFGDATFEGSATPLSPPRPIVAMAATPGGGGYWLMTVGGGVYDFGSAPFEGSISPTHNRGPMVAVAPTADGGGYWLAARNGNVYHFGDAANFGSLGGRGLRMAGLIDERGSARLHARRDQRPQRVLRTGHRGHHTVEHLDDVDHHVPELDGAAQHRDGAASLGGALVHPGRLRRGRVPILGARLRHHDGWSHALCHGLPRSDVVDQHGESLVVLVELGRDRLLHDLGRAHAARHGHVHLGRRGRG